MCGICGIINFSDLDVQERDLRQMMQIMKHRGPDDEGVFLDNNIGLGFVRLSIIDLSIAGHQPKVSSDGKYVIVFNGEIYNYIELREELIKEGVVFDTQTDTEVLLNAYIHWGENCMSRFNGMWSIAIYNKLDKKVFIARDRYGIKPFYYLQTKNYFAFCSEIPPLLSLLDRKPEPDYQSIFDYFVFNRTDQTERTFFTEIKKLQHGHSVTFDLNPSGSDNELKIKQWYNLRSRVKLTEGFKDPKEFLDLFTSSLGLRLRSDVPVGVCFSGGVDSSSIVSVLLQKYDKQDLNTFSAVYNKGQTGDETEFIQEYASQLKNMSYITPDASSLEHDMHNFVKAHGEPIPGTSPYAQFKVMELAKGKVVVTLDGQGADEEFAGYHYFFGFYFKDLLKHGRIGKLFKEIFHYIQKHKSLFGVKTFIYFMLPERMRTSTRVNEKGYLKPEFIEKYKNNNSIAGNLYGSGSLKDALLDHFEYKLEHLLKWEDRNSMYFSLEARVPFLDYRIVEKVMATSGDLMIKNGMTKYLLRESMKGILPEKIRTRRDKMGFETPEDEWFRSPAWQKIVLNILNSESFLKRNLVDPQKAIKQYQKHLQGKINVSREIWKWVHLELWFREFIDIAE
ncbi:MAG: asparagine synthase (glutamine-hydrolyzing) [Bacteroidota bacterium]